MFWSNNKTPSSFSSYENAIFITFASWGISRIIVNLTVRSLTEKNIAYCIYVRTIIKLLDVSTCSEFIFGLLILFCVYWLALLFILLSLQVYIFCIFIF